MNNFQRLYDLIDEHGLTAKAVAEETGISSGNISDWKSGRSMPASKKLVQLADYFGCSVDYLLERTDTPYAVTVLDSVLYQIAANDRYFIDLNKIIHKPANGKIFCYIKHKDRGKIKKIYFLAKRFTGSKFSEKEFCSIFEYHSDPSAREYGISLSAKNFLAFRKIYTAYLNAYINNRLLELSYIG